MLFKRWYCLGYAYELLISTNLSVLKSPTQLRNKGLLSEACDVELPQALSDASEGAQSF